jgi:hydroxyacylglutathione hydrolase
MILRRIFHERLAQASYIVACDHTRLALIVDPNRDIAQYIDALAEQKLKLVAVTETHIHADFVSGSRELAQVTGAKLYLSGDGGADWQYAFAGESGAIVLRDGDTFDIGKVRIQALHTPGHTPEHMTFLVTDTAVGNEPMGALTGDFIFVGDVGRPDLLERAAGMAGTMEKGAHQLFQSIREFKKHPDYLQIWPGHGAGSPCGKALGSMPQSTLGYEKLFNWALAESDEEAFVREVLAGQPEPPAYFARMKLVNRNGPAPSPDSLPPALDESQLRQASDPVVDTRGAHDYAAGHLKNSINIPLGKAFLKWAGSLLPYDRDLYFIADASEDERRALARELSQIGIEKIAGVFPASRLNDLKPANDFVTLNETTIEKVNANGTATIVDVRARSEYAEGHLPNALNIPVGELPQRLDEVPRGEIIVHCQGGTRSAIAASILQQSGRDDVSNMLGGFAEWERKGLAVERSNGQG